MIRDVLKKVERFGGIVLIEYSSLDHPEVVFREVLEFWRKMGIRPMIVDIGETLNIFVKQLEFEGETVGIDDIPVIKELGKLRLGRVIGEVSEIEDFEYHMAKYAQVARKVPKESRKHTIVLGMEKFVFNFLDDPPKLERYFERINRRYLKSEDLRDVIFLNVSVASDYLTKSLEQDSDYVLRLKRDTLEVVKSPWGWVE
ncbi:DUF257 family protein [Thermococcus gorgonarius]|uniref:Uncharacterized protein n=1 Tax=Thermococcus gorgonarius TaxID=71997 RepID=A0A2Z2MCH0_THEGO|nr:DUF257 family protein [Thermococcus gorgonarius]ASJ01644.1 hypothetical protein A3K92_09200 [Thermococcus gorgonarius]